MDVAVLIFTNVISALHPRALTKILTYVTIGTTIIVVGYVIYVILKSPYNSPYYLNLANSYSGFTGIATGLLSMAFSCM
ncbi:MAG: hypothetical protein QXP36_10415 [Conexivisphaerales archaeon]